MIASLSDLSIFLASFCLMFSKSKYHTILEHQGVLKYYFRIVLEIPLHGLITIPEKEGHACWLHCADIFSLCSTSSF